MINIKNFGKYLNNFTSLTSGTISSYKTNIKNLIEILNKIEDYRNMTNNDKVIAFSELENNTYSKHLSPKKFNDYRSVARKYKEYLDSEKNNIRNSQSLEIKNSNIGKIMQNEKKQTQALNQILFGSPGTGKTYKTINKALEIIDPEFYYNNKDKRDVLKTKFEEYKKSGQIEFITFHQSSTLIKNSLYKVRIKNSDKNRGKSGGYRVYYYIKSQENIYLLTIYDKSEIESINEEILTELIEGILKYEE